MAKPRVHEIASEFGIDSKVALAMLRDMGERVNSPSSTLQPPVARRLRAALSDQPGPAVLQQGDALIELPKPTAQIPLHPEGAWFTIRRNLLLREERDWGALGISTKRKASWVRAGVPENKAHIAAMLIGQNPVPPSALRTQMPSGRTLLYEALAGTNEVRIRQRIARSQRAPLIGIRDDLITVIGKPGVGRYDDEEVALRERVEAIERRPDALPMLVDTMTEMLTSTTRVDLAILRLAATARAYLAAGAIEPLLSDFAHAHGVMSAGQHLHTLAEAAVTYAEDTHRSQRASAAVLFRAAAEARHYIFVDDDVVEALDGAPGHLELPPPPVGVAYLRHENRPDDVLAWASQPAGLHCAIFNPAALGRRDGRPDVVAFDELSDDPAARALRAIARLRTPQVGAGSRARDEGGRTPAADDAIEAGATGLRSVVLHYRRDTGEVGSSPRTRRRPDHRWEVRGHHRRQWYPRAKEHHVVWIDDHTAGPLDRPLIRVDRVEVL